MGSSSLTIIGDAATLMSSFDNEGFSGCITQSGEKENNCIEYEYDEATSGCPYTPSECQEVQFLVCRTIDDFYRIALGEQDFRGTLRMRNI